MTKCKFNVKNSSFEVLVVFSPIFVVGTKITFAFNFVTPLIIDKNIIFFSTYLHLQKQPPEVICKKVFLKNSQNLPENTCAGVSFLVKLQGGGLQLPALSIFFIFHVETEQVLI